MFFQPSQVVQTARFGGVAGVIVPVGRGGFGVIELAVPPFVKLRMAIQKGEIRDLSVVVAREMVNGWGIHVDAEHWATQALVVDFPKEEYGGAASRLGGTPNDHIALLI